MWSGDKVYFLSDRNGEFNLFSFDRKTKEIKQWTSFSDFPVLNASIGGGKIVLEQAGYLHLFDPQTAKSTKLTIGLAADLLELRPRYVKGPQWVRSGSLSPSGARAVLEYRGEIVTVPAEKGDFRNLTNTPAAHDRTPVWSPDGKSIATVSDESGEYELFVRGQDGKGEPKRYKINGAGFYDSLVWSPDSQKISFADNSESLFWIDLKTGAVKKIGQEYYYSPFRSRTMTTVWSPDSQWIAYSLNTTASIQRIHVYSLEQDKSFPVTDGLSEAAEPVFDKSGKYLYFFGSTDAGPVKNWFDQSAADMRMTSSIYLAVLRKDVPSPLAKESDEEKPAEKEEKKDVKAPEAASRRTRRKTKQPPRIRKLRRSRRRNSGSTSTAWTTASWPCPVPSGYYWNLQAGDEGQVYYLETKTVEGGVSGRRAGVAGALHRYDMKARKDEVVLPEAEMFMLTADKKKIGLHGQGLLLDRAGRRKARAGEGQAQPRGNRGPDRPARRVEADLQRGLADQPRLFLRPQHARGGLAGHEGTSMPPSSPI